MNNRASSGAPCVFLQGMKCACFENLSTIVQIESCLEFVIGNPVMKSMAMSSHGAFGMGNDCNLPCVLPLSYFTLWQMSHS